MMTNWFHYQNETLYVENVPIEKIVKSVGTPFYCYSTRMLEDNYQTFTDAIDEINGEAFYSIKANSNLAVLTALANRGANMDAVSIGEIKRARMVGVSGYEIVFSGVGKTAEEISYALDQKILMFNVESVAELKLIAKLAKEKQVVAPIAIRVNLDVKVSTHKKLATTGIDKKFGIPADQIIYTMVLIDKLPSLELKGLHLHLGSNLNELEDFNKAFMIFNDLVNEVQSRGYQLKYLNLGGGLPSNQFINFYVDIIKRQLGQFDGKFLFEPGRAIVGNIGTLITKVIRIKFKKENNHRTVIVDAGMNDFLRSSLYDIKPMISTVTSKDNSELMSMCDIVGPICESGDYIANNCLMWDLKPNELLSIRCVGAYGAVMSSTYNSRDLIPEVMVKGKEYEVIRRRHTTEDIMKLERIPSWSKV